MSAADLIDGQRPESHDVAQNREVARGELNARLSCRHALKGSPCDDLAMTAYHARPPESSGFEGVRICHGRPSGVAAEFRIANASFLCPSDLVTGGNNGVLALFAGLLVRPSCRLPLANNGAEIFRSREPKAFEPRLVRSQRSYLHDRVPWPELNQVLGRHSEIAHPTRTS